MSSLPMVLTIEGAASRLLTTPEKVQAELEAGRLEGFRLGEEWRITEPALLKFMGISLPETSARTPPMSTATMTAPQSPDFDAILADVEWKPVEPLVYKWPDEHPAVTYDEVYEGQVAIGPNTHTLRIAFCTAESLGDKHRRRGVVFMGYPPSLNPLVEFSGENSPAFEVTGRLASIVKLRTGKHLRPGQPVPPEYTNFPQAVYNQLVVGPYAAASMAVVVHRTDFRLMAHHALIRAHWKGLI